jgi:AbiTii
MVALIEELQRDALNQKVTLTELLQKCLVVAVKLGVKELEAWARLELDGYSDKNVPRYRDVRGDPQVHNPYQRDQPLRSEDTDVFEQMSLMHFSQPISEIEYHLLQCHMTNSASFDISFAPNVERMLRESVTLGLTPSLRVNASQLQKILEAVRRAVTVSFDSCVLQTKRPLK